MFSLRNVKNVERYTKEAITSWMIMLAYILKVIGIKLPTYNSKCHMKWNPIVLKQCFKYSVAMCIDIC